MSKMIIRNRSSKEVGYIMTDSKGRQTAYNIKGEKLGSFDPKTNITKNNKNVSMGSGNLLAGIILSNS